MADKPTPPPPAVPPTPLRPVPPAQINAAVPTPRAFHPGLAEVPKLTQVAKQKATAAMQAARNQLTGINTASAKLREVLKLAEQPDLAEAMTHEGADLKALKDLTESFEALLDKFMPPAGR